MTDAQLVKLKNQASMLDAILATTPSHFYMYDREGRYLFASQSGARALGLRPEDIIGKTWRELGFPANIMEPFETRLKEVFETTGEITAETLFPTISGTRKFEYSISPVHDEEGNVNAAIATVTDITEHSHTEDALMQSNNLLQAISHAHQQFISDVDTHVLFDELLNNLLELTQSEYGFIGEVLYRPEGKPYLKTHAITNIAWNEETLALYNKYASIGMEFTNLETLFGTVMTSGEKVISNNPAADSRSGGIPQGHPPLNAFLGLPFYKGNKLVGMVGIANRPEGYDEDLCMYLDPFLSTCANIIEAYRIERQSRLSEENRIKALNEITGIMDTVQDVVLMIDTEGHIINVNRKVEEIVGGSRDKLKGKPLFDFMHKEDRSVAIDGMREASLKGRSSMEVKLIDKEGKYILHSFISAAISDAEGKIEGLVAVGRDITEQKKIEEELLKAQKLESLGILAGGIAHDFNNILTAIVGYISLAKLFTNPGEKMYEALGKAEKASFRARDLSQQLLTFSKGGKPVKKVVNVKTLLREAADFVLRGSNVKCRYSVPDDLLPVKADEGQLNQVFQNLIINADQAMQSGGLVEINAENMMIDAEDMPSLQIGRYVRIDVKDHGVGISGEYLKRIFDPYFTTKETGSGLGLSTAYSIIKNHGGHISVESEAGFGTIFHVYLSASEEKVIEQMDKEKYPVHRGGRVLIMDDEELIREFAADALRHVGYEVELAKDGTEAIELYCSAKETGQPFDVVIMDLTVPGGLGGKDAIKELLHIDPMAKVVVSSGYSNDPIMSDYKAYGFKGFVAKPYKVIDLSETVSRVILL